MGVPAGMLRHFCTIERRAVNAGDLLKPRGDYAPVAGLTRLPAGHRTIALRSDKLGNMATTGAEAEITLRDCAAVRGITVADIAVLNGQRFTILAVDLPDTLHGVLRLQVSRAQRVA